jgi:hypothetical protein
MGIQLAFRRMADLVWPYVKTAAAPRQKLPMIVERDGGFVPSLPAATGALTRHADCAVLDRPIQETWGRILDPKYVGEFYTLDLLPFRVAKIRVAQVHFGEIRPSQISSAEICSRGKPCPDPFNRNKRYRPSVLGSFSMT